MISRRAFRAAVAAVATYSLVQLELLVAIGRAGSLSSEKATKTLPLMLKFHKTGGTSVASALTRAVLCSDLTYSAWRDLLDSHHALRFCEELSINSDTDKRKCPLALATVTPPISMFRMLSRVCGNYDGHWATTVYRYMGPVGMRACGGLLPQRPNTKLITLLRDPMPRFVSRLYYELGGQTELLLKPPFSQNVSSWTSQDIREMERISCEACATINGGHCRWRGGICDSPQEYTVVLSHLAPYGPRGMLERRGSKHEAYLEFVSTPNSGVSALKTARIHAAHALLKDFSVIGVLEDLHSFLVLLALELDWPPDALLYATRKSHINAARANYENTPCARVQRDKELIQGRISERRGERLQKRADASKHKQNGVAFSGVWPLLGWNALIKGPLRPDTKAYIDRRNTDDIYLWTLAQLTARDRFVRAGDSVAHKQRFDALQRAYATGSIRDAHGFYSFCEWQVKDHQRFSTSVTNAGTSLESARESPNALCLQCAASLPTKDCGVFLHSGGASARPLGACRAGFNPDTDLELRYEPGSGSKFF